MTENEAKERCDLLINSLSVNTGVESAFRNDSTGYMNFTTMREFAQTCKKALEEVDRWHTSIVNPRIKNVFANHSTQICQNCDHKDEYIEELEAEIEQYQKIGTPEECKTAMELYNEMHNRKFTLEAAEEYMKFEDELVRRGLTFSNLIDLMEKNTPKKPRFNGKNWYRCHNGCEVHTVGFRRDLYCPNCGQKIDWKGVED
nr:MAG TPA: E3 ubiquitin-protein ligase [Caudoviricetes sp.]